MYSSGLIKALAITVFIVWLVKLYLKRRRLFKMASAFPSVKSGAFGVLGDFFGKSIEECMQQLLKYFEDADERTQKAWFGHYLVIGLTKPEHIGSILTNKNCLERTVLGDFFKCFVGNGIMLASVDEWKKNRKIINQVFSPRMLNSFTSIFAEKCEDMIRNLEGTVKYPDVDVYGSMSKVALETICETALGTSVGDQACRDQYSRSLSKFMDTMMIRMMNIFYHFQIIFDMSKVGKLTKNLVKEMQKLTKNVLIQRRNAFKTDVKENNITEQDDVIYTNFLDKLLPHFSDEQLCDEINTLVAAGTDTTALTLSYCLIMMGMHSELQQKLYEEAIDILGEDGYATKSDLPKLNYTEMFIKETLRLFPPLPFCSRKTTDDVKLDNDLVIPKDAFIVFSPLNVHRNCQYWKDPLKFDPDRFLPESSTDRSPFSFLPFLGGPRNCIGAKYAMMHMKLIISKIVRKFKVKTDYKSIEDIDLEIIFLLRPKNGFKISMELRK